MYHQWKRDVISTTSTIKTPRLAGQWVKCHIMPHTITASGHAPKINYNKGVSNWIPMSRNKIVTCHIVGFIAPHHSHILNVLNSHNYLNPFYFNFDKQLTFSVIFFLVLLYRGVTKCYQILLYRPFNVYITRYQRNIRRIMYVYQDVRVSLIYLIWWVVTSSWVIF